jgi:hypothetical protein
VVEINGRGHVGIIGRQGGVAASNARRLSSAAVLDGGGLFEAQG